MRRCHLSSALVSHMPGQERSLIRLENSDHFRAYPLEKELRWLEDQLMQSTADWLIVTGHRPVYSGALRDSWPAENKFKQLMQKVLSRNRVDMYINGHDHTGAHHSTLCMSGSDAASPCISSFWSFVWSSLPLPRK